MIKLKELLSESRDKVFIQDDMLWVSYSPGSGQTTPIRNLRTYWTDKSSDSNFESNVRNIVKWSETQKPILKNKISRVHKIPVYDRGRGRTSSELSIWGGIQTPNSFLYLLIATETNGIHVVSFFKSRKEIVTWLKGQSRG